MTTRWSGRVLVSGCASGLGSAIVQAVHGCGGAALGIDVSRHDDLACDHVVADVRDADAVARAVALLVGDGPLDAVVTAAGIDACGPLADVAPEHWSKVIGVNLVGTANVVRAALPHLRRSNGRILTVASTLGHRAVSDATAYCASKFGVVGFTRALQAELRDEVPVTLVTPGGMRTPFFDGRPEQYRPAHDAPLLAPDEVAAVIVRAITDPVPAARELVVASPAEPSWP